MSSIGKFFTNISNAMNMNKATLSGALDVVVVEHPDGSFHATPFHVRFGKLKLLKTSAKTVSLTVNGKLSNIRMKLGEEGEAYFVEATNEEIEESSVCSPIVSPRSTFEERKTFEISSEKSEVADAGPMLRRNSIFDKSKLTKLVIPGQILPMRGDDCEEVDQGEDLESINDPGESEDQVEMSLCADLIVNPNVNLEKAFIQNRVLFSDFQQDP